MQDKNNLFFNSFGNIADIYGALDTTKYVKNDDMNDVDILLNDWVILANDFYLSKTKVLNGN